MKWLMNIVLLLANLIEPTFYVLYNNVKDLKCTNLLKYFTYYLNNWIHGKNWSIADICQWNCSVRTNNDAERFHMKLMGEANKTNMPFYELVNLLGNFATRVTMDAKTFVVTFENELKKAQDRLRKNEISPIQFLNLLTSEKHNNRLVDEAWGLNHSRIDVLPEAEESDEDPDVLGSETVDSDEDDSN